VLENRVMDQYRDCVFMLHQAIMSNTEPQEVNILAESTAEWEMEVFAFSQTPLQKKHGLPLVLHKVLKQLRHLDFFVVQE
jgi:hypothetical protein